MMNIGMNRRLPLVACILALISACEPSVSEDDASDLPDGFVRLSEFAPSIVQDIRYFSPNNFVGTKVDGYLAGECVLTEPAAKALRAAQVSFESDGYSLIVFDCYRPQPAVDHFVRWAQSDDETTKRDYYPNVDKGRLFELGYIAEKSGHSRGSTVDLGLIKLKGEWSPDVGRLPVSCIQSDVFEGSSLYLNFGTLFDCFDELSHTENSAVSAEAMANRLYLRSVLEAHGFSNYSKEWWHFTLVGEPHSDRYFDFPVQ